MKNKVIISVVAGIMLVGCANTRDPNVISMKSGTDDGASCNLLEAEYNANTDAATGKISKNNSDDGRDILLGALIWPGLADFKNADGIEGNALIDRNKYVRELALVKTCDVTDWPGQPTRYN